MSGLVRSQFLSLCISLASPTLLGAQSYPAATTPEAPTVLQVNSPSLGPQFGALSPEQQGDLLMARGSYAAAIDAYQHGSLRSATVWNKMGMAYHHLFAFEEARKHYQTALVLNPRYPEALNNLAAVYHTEHNYKRAERIYKQALKYAPNSAVTYCNLGTAYFTDHKYKQGSKAYQKALALDPNVFDVSQNQIVQDGSSRSQLIVVYYNLAKAYATAGKNENALTYLRKALDAGYKDRHHLMEDKEFAELRKTPEFHKLLVEKLDTDLKTP
jgi:tetratricopeptide (TPR) repeat protein